MGFGGPDYDLSSLQDLIAWRDEYRERRDPRELTGSRWTNPPDPD
jgi:hypothetical protein